VPIHIRPDGPGIVVPREATGGVVAIVEQRMAPRHLIGGHVHKRHDVWIHVFEGEVGVRVGDDEATARAGDYLLKPRGVPHAMWNPGDTPNRFIEIITPGDGDGFFRRKPESPDEWAEHGIEWFDGWDDDLKSKYGLR
jgi:quercetin dioxygenase-like cupin family protein